MTAANERYLVNVAEVAPALGIAKDTCYRLVRRGEFPLEPIRIGKLLFFRRVDFERLLGVTG